MSTASTTLMVLAVIIPASAASVLVLAADVRTHRRPRPSRWTPTGSRLTAALGAALGVAGFGVTSVAGVAGLGHAARAADATPEQVWVTTAGPDTGQTVIAPAQGQAAVQLPFAPAVVWGTGFDGEGGYVVLAEVPGGSDVPLVGGGWTRVTGEGVRPLALLDPAAIVDAARAHGILPADGVFALELRSADPPANVHFTLADRPAPAAAAPAPPAAAAPPPQSFTVPTTGAVAPAARPAHAAAAAAAAAVPSPGIRVPATGSGAPLLGGLALLLAGGACAGLSLRLRRGGPLPS